eukprot:2896078-Pyramimonas_sp.AAC.1
MADGALPGPNDADAPRRAARALRENVLAPFRALRDLDVDELKSLVETQRKRFAQGGTKDADVPVDDAPDRDDVGAAGAGAVPAEAAQARWELSEELPRPSDFVKRLVKKFEDGA